MATAQPKSLLDEETQKFLTERFSAMRGDVEIHSFVSRQAAEPVSSAPTEKGNGGEPKPESKAADEKLLFENFTLNFCRALAECSPRVRHVEHVGPYTPPDKPGKGDLTEAVELVPSVLVRAAGTDLPLLRLTGAPLG